MKREYDGMHHYAFRDAKDELACLVCTEHIVLIENVMDIVYAALGVQCKPKEYEVHIDLEWNIAEWYTWAALELCPVVEIIFDHEIRGIADEVRQEWTWRRVKP